MSAKFWKKLFIKKVSRFFFQQQAVVERFALCEENISILLKWINDIEQRISKIGGPQENFDDLQTQINILRVSLKSIFEAFMSGQGFLSFKSF